MSTRNKELAEKKPARDRATMPVIIRNTPPGYNWGWYATEEPRMHLQTVDQQHRNLFKIWLEERGRRVCEPVGKIPSKVFKSIQTAIARNRMTIEDHWVGFAIRQRWMQAHLAAPLVTVVVYPNTPNAFTRNIDLTPHLLMREIQALRPEDVTFCPEMASLQIWPWRPEDERQDIRLSRQIWQG
jgi:hypothetical protein